ncbi:hypothetical protein [Hymenobacter negativus]|uniref:Uncharacterized protein n=1 Tax=Hymenobacter negativus TaxID=2795026 RepID=A0ABS3QK69_9BACT|nr:hypothetical protein [Hymenobacter negativus]MBO2011637.1 hypothetical protein [Hymenobacter negativus]
MSKTIIVNDQSYRLDTVTGTVLAASKSMETKVQGSASGGGGRLHNGSGSMRDVNLTMNSTTVVHDQFFLQDAAGKEHAFQLQGFNVACREGNVLDVVTAFAPGAQRGPYVMVYNNATQMRFYNDQAIKQLCSPSFWRYLLVCLALLVVEFKLLSGFFLIAGSLFATVFAMLVAYGIKSGNNLQDFKNKL